MVFLNVFKKKSRTPLDTGYRNRYLYGCTCTCTCTCLVTMVDGGNRTRDDYRHLVATDLPEDAGRVPVHGDLIPGPGLQLIPGR